MPATAPWRWTETLAWATLAWVAAAANVHANTGSPAPPAPGEPSTQAVVVALVLNATLLSDAQLTHLDADGRVWLPQREALGWRLKTQAREHRNIEGVRHVAFCGGQDPEERCFYDDSSALLTIRMAGGRLNPLQFAPTALASAELPTNTDDRGLWVNYDLVAWRYGRPGLSAQLDGRVFTPEGQGALRLDAVRVAGKTQVLRKAWLWRSDDPTTQRTLQVGHYTMPDTSFGAGLQAVGVRWGSNSALRPELSQALRPRYEAQASERALRADVFVDGLYRQTADVPYGPYSVEVAPPWPGRGQLDVLTTDISGQQKRFSMPYYQAPNQLTPGAREWALDAGLLEDSRGRVPRHGLVVLGAQGRAGVDHRSTVQAQALVAGQARRLAVGIDTVDATLGQTSFSLVVQKTPLRQGGQGWVGLGHELLTRGYALSARGEWSLTACERQDAPAAYDRFGKPCRRFTASASGDINPRWSMALGLHTEHNAHRGGTYSAFAGLRWQVAARSQLAINLQNARSPSAGSRTMQVSWSMPLGGQWQGQSSHLRRNNEAGQLQWSAQRQNPADTPEPTQLQTYGSVGPKAYVGARYAVQGANADWRAEGRATGREVQGALAVAGAGGWTTGRWFAGRRINDAFVLVDAGLPNLPVLLDNREVARTNAAGWVVVTEARAWQRNAIGVDIATLPIEYAMPRDLQQVVPRGGSGTLARFDISDGGISLPVRTAAGQRLPTGAQAQVSSQRLGTAVTSSGELFLDRSDLPADITIQWPGGQCKLRYEPKVDQERYLCMPV